MVNKNFLIKSIKSVSGFLAIWCTAMFILFVGLTYYPWPTAITFMAGMVGFMIYMDYTNRIKTHELEVKSALKRVIHND